jgi:hypothetical protein
VFGAPQRALELIREGLPENSTTSARIGLPLLSWGAFDVRSDREKARDFIFRSGARRSICPLL